MIEIYNAKSEHEAIVKETVEAVFHHFEMKDADVDVEIDFLSEQEIRELNKESRDVDAVTDVLSFQNLDVEMPFKKEDYPEDVNPETEAAILGEICICLKRAEEQAKELGHGLLREISFLTCHGMLHLLGYDHIKPEDEEEMTAKQREIIGTAEEEAGLETKLKVKPRKAVAAVKEEAAVETKKKVKSTEATADTSKEAAVETKKKVKSTEATADTSKEAAVETKKKVKSTEATADTSKEAAVETKKKVKSTEATADTSKEAAVETKKKAKPCEVVVASTEAAEIGAEPQSKPINVGFIAVVGKPNAGKSTLVNALVGEKVSIVSWKPQTTRNSIMGIYNDADAQIVFIDTPGLHAPQNTLGKFMMHGVTAALNETNFILYVVDAERGLREEDAANITRYLASEKKVIVAVNKIDHVTKEKVMEILAALTNIAGIFAVVPVSALRERNTAPLLAELKNLLPSEAERMFDEELYTTQNMRFMAAEIIREKALRLLDDEIPYGIGININKYEYRESGVLDIDADVVLENQKHKPIVLGKGGQMIKKISTYAREDLEKITGDKIMLTLWVRVKEAWRDSPQILSDLGYTKKKDG